MIAQPLARPLAGPLARSIGGAGLGFTYPKDGLILDLDKFDYTFVEVPDKSPEDNDAILYSARGVTLDGVNDLVDLGTVTTAGPVTELKMLARSSTDTTVPTSLGSGTIVANGTWQEAAFETPAKDYGGKMWFDGVDDGIRGVNYTLADGETVATDFIYDGGFKWLFDLEESNAAIYVNTGGSYDVRIRSGGINYNYGDGDSFSPSFSDLSTLSISRSGNDYTVTANGESLGTQTITTPFKILGIGGGSFPFHGVYTATHLGSISWDGTTADAVAKGWTIDGSPETVTDAFTSPTVTLGDGFAGDLSDSRLYGAGSTLFEQFYLNEHTDPTVDGLNTLPCVGRNGNIGSYVGCTAVVQEGVDERAAKLGGLESEYYFEVGGQEYELDSVKTLQDGETWSFDYYLHEIPTANKYAIGTTSDGLAILSDGGVRVVSNSISVNLAINWVFGQVDTVTMTRVGATLTVTTGDGSESAAIVGGFQAGFLGSRGSQSAFGVFYNPNFADLSLATINGNPPTVGQLRTAPPQVLGMDFNQYAAFDGSTTSETIPTITLSGDFTSEVEGILFNNLTTNNTIWGLSTNRFFVTNLGLLRLRISAVNYDFSTLSFSEGKGYSIELDRIGSNITATVTDQDGVVQSETITGPSGSISVSEIGYRTGPTDVLDGLIHRVSFDGVVVFSGADAADNTLIPESFTKGIDAYGNAIVSPRTNKAFNTDESGYAQVPSSSSLDVTTEATWVLRGNFYRTVSNTVRLVSRDFDGNRCWSFGKFTNTSADRIAIELFSGNGASTSNITGLTDKVADLIVTFNNGTLRAWWDGVEISVGGTPPSVIDADPAPIRILTRQAGEKWPASFGALELFKLYDRALTDEEIQNATWK